MASQIGRPTRMPVGLKQAIRSPEARLEDAYARYLLTVALLLEQFTSVRPVKRSVDAAARLLRLPPRRASPKPWRMSDRWLREHEIDAEKHGATFTYG